MISSGAAETKKHVARAKVIEGVVYVAVRDLVDFIDPYQDAVIVEVKNKLCDLMMNTQKKHEEGKK